VNAKRLTLLVVAGLLVTGCGVTAGVLRSGAPTSAPAAGANDVVALATASASPAAAATASPSPTQSPAATSLPAATPPVATTPPPPPSVIAVANENSASGPLEVALVTSDGRVLASTNLPPDARWTIGVGARAAYWVTRGKLRSIDEHGVVTTLATVPLTESGRVVLSPDGSQWAYATTSTVKNTTTNRIYRGAIGQPARLVVETTADYWQYYLLSWTAQGILIERQPLGGCGCAPFDMQMTAASTAFINPVTGTATSLGTTGSCPLSGIGSDATLACFHQTLTGASDSLRFVTGSHTTYQYTLSGKTVGGAATFNGSTLAYATVPTTAAGCGGPDWRSQTTLRVMDIRTGDAIIVGRTGLSPVAWLADGSILATLSVAHGAGSTNTVVAVDPTTGSVRTVFNQSFNVIGLA
jgi:hypothetical protein